MAPDPPAEPDDRHRHQRLPQILPSQDRGPSISTSSSMSSLVAAPPPSPPTQQSTSASPPAPISKPPVSLPPRGRMTRVACEACRKRRAKCSGDRPACVACVKNQSECRYTSASPSETNAQALKRKYEETREETNIYKELYHYLYSLPESQALGILHRIRLGTHVTSIVRQIKDGDLLLQVSLVPEARLRYDFPYRPTMPLAITNSNNAYLSSILYEAVFIGDQKQETEQGQGQDQGVQQAQQQKMQDLATRYSPAYLKPYHAAKHIEPLLSTVDVSRWTSVMSDNDLFVALLSAYFVHEYPTYPVFQKDIFLRAMVEGDDRFCSPLLVNALMAEACHCYHGIPNRSMHWAPLNLSYRFLAEARRLWEIEAGEVTLVHIQTALVLNIVYTHNGLDLPGRTYFVQAIAMGHEMGLFGANVLVDDEQLSNARLFTAWSIFRWAVILSFNYQRPSLLKEPPAVPPPDPDENPAWFSDVYVQYPLSETRFITSHGHLFSAWSDLRVITNNLSLVTYNRDSPAAISADQYLSLHRQLKAWFTSLPAPLTPENIVWPSQFKLHMEYYVVLICMAQMRVLKSEGTVTEEEDELVVVARNTAAQTLPYAVVRLETVIRLYYLRHSFKFCDTYMTYFLSMLVNIVMESKSGKLVAFKEKDSLEHLRSTLVLCLQGLADQGRHAHVTAVICKLLLERQAPEDANMLGGYIPLDILETRSTMDERVYSAYPLQSGMAENPDASRLENLVKKYNLDQEDAAESS